MKSYVSVKGEWITMSRVEFLDIEEDISGRDLVTFKYQGEVYKSFVINR